jgi:hypothetical protein
MAAALPCGSAPAPWHTAARLQPGSAGPGLTRPLTLVGWSVTSGCGDLTPTAAMMTRRGRGPVAKGDEHLGGVACGV